MDEELEHGSDHAEFRLDVAPSAANAPLLVADGHSMFDDELPIEDKVSALLEKLLPRTVA